MASAVFSSTAAPSSSGPSSDVNMNNVVDFFKPVWSKVEVENFYRKLTPEQKNTLLNRIENSTSGFSGGKPESLKALFDKGLSADQALAALKNGRLFDAQGNMSGLASDPTADIVLRLLILVETLGVDMKKLKIRVAQEKKDTAYHAADKRFEGAQNAFIVSMASAATTVGVGAVFARCAYKSGPDAGQWFSPITVQLIVSPLNSVSEHQRAQGDLQGSKEEANVQFVDTSLESITQFIQSLSSTSQAAAGAITARN